MFGQATRQTLSSHSGLFSGYISGDISFVNFCRTGLYRHDPDQICSTIVKIQTSFTGFIYYGFSQKCCYCSQY